ncbi:hypothetical protein KPH14_001812 [Odynerus spinipes]|uniref:Uncharacterized protein n=1 Tax=Odynerus spinipes TaxID=1348599 RepID=A0AAD9RZU5_9HYME|nr:hypothetical protein KPH14_001812 [Odynerus spinipes]
MRLKSGQINELGSHSDGIDRKEALFLSDLVKSESGEHVKDDVSPICAAIVHSTLQERSSEGIKRCHKLAKRLIGYAIVGQSTLLFRQIYARWHYTATKFTGLLKRVSIMAHNDNAVPKPRDRYLIQSGV